MHLFMSRHHTGGQNADINTADTSVKRVLEREEI